MRMTDLHVVNSVEANVLFKSVIKRGGIYIIDDYCKKGELYKTIFWAWEYAVFHITNILGERIVNVACLD